MTVVVVATIHPLPERRGDVIAAMEAVIARTHAEDDGCLLYALHKAPDRLVMIEKWTSEEALAAHLRGAAIAELQQQTAGLMSAPPDILTLEPHPAGSAEQGIV